MFKVLVGCPTADYKAYCLDKYIIAVKSLSYKNYDVLLVDNSHGDGYINKIKKHNINVLKCMEKGPIRARIVASRNMLREIMLEKGYDYFLSLEQDVIPPNNIIERLLSHGRKIITAVYFTYNTRNNVTRLVPVLYAKSRKGDSYLRTFKPEEIEPERLVEVRACGLGCVLIHRDVLERVKFRYDKDYEAFDDIHFSNDAVSSNFRIFADTGIRCRHLIKGWNWLDVQEEV